MGNTVPAVGQDTVRVRNHQGKALKVQVFRHNVETYTFWIADGETLEFTLNWFVSGKAIVCVHMDENTILNCFFSVCSGDNDLLEIKNNTFYFNGVERVNKGSWIDCEKFLAS